MQQGGRQRIVAYAAAAGRLAADGSTTNGVGLDLAQVRRQALGGGAVAAHVAGDALPEEARQAAGPAVDPARADVFAARSHLVEAGLRDCLQDGCRPVAAGVALGLAGGEPGIELLSDLGLAPAGGCLQRDLAGLAAGLDLSQDLKPVSERSYWNRSAR